MKALSAVNCSDSRRASASCRHWSSDVTAAIRGRGSSWPRSMPAALRTLASGESAGTSPALSAVQRLDPAGVPALAGGGCVGREGGGERQEERPRVIDAWRSAVAATASPCLKVLFRDTRQAPGRCGRSTGRSSRPTTMDGGTSLGDVVQLRIRARRVWGSNPRDGMNRLAAFKAAALGHYANPPTSSTANSCNQSARARQGTGDLQIRSSAQPESDPRAKDRHGSGDPHGQRPRTVQRTRQEPGMSSSVTRRRR